MMRLPDKLEQQLWQKIEIIEEATKMRYVTPGLTRLQKFDFRISMLRREFFLYGTTF
uniref:Uncharacterized protein n=1 Tax=Candidatus Kentrum sp. DK TaxID=2126562 RepID=A0A450TS14_9GAMM|nr:MAG: hypothetical protein BECKDK2373B_GA0170837_13102 [Candidatus Kentron sp. DK]